MRIVLRNGWLLFAVLAGSAFASFAQAVPIDPASLSGRVLHLRADQDVYSDLAGTVVAGNDDPVRHWGDQSVSNSPALNSVGGAQQPAFVTNVFPVNNLPALRFDGVNDFLAQALDLNTGAKTVFVVYQLDTQSIGDIDSIFSFRDSVANTWTEVAVFRSLAGYQDLSFTTDQNGATTARGISGYTYNTDAHLLGFSYNGSGNTTNANFNGALDLSSPAVIASNTFNRTASDLGAIGARLFTAGGTTSLPFDGSIGEIVIFDRQLSGSEFSGVQEFLYNKFFVEVPPAPEPSTALLTGMALAFTVVRRRKKLATC